MAIIGTLSISAIVDTRKFGAGVGNMRKGLAGFSANIKQTSGLMSGLFVGAAFGAGAAGLGKLVVAASDVSEAINMVQAQFGPGADLIIAKSLAMADAFGISRKVFLESAGQFGGMFEGAGFANKQVAEMSNRVLQLAIDARSLKNVRLEEATTKIAAGLAGESEPLRRWGINILEANVKAKALAMGMTLVSGKMTDQQKILARLQLITEGLRAAEGDRAKTAGSVANLMDEVSGRTANLAATMGTVLEPAAQSVLTQIATGLTAMSIGWTENQTAVLAWATSAVGGMTDMGRSMGIVQSAAGGIADAFQVMGIIFKSVQLGLMLVVNSVVTMFATLEKGVDWLTGRKGSGFFQAWQEGLDAIGKTGAEELKARLKEPWAHNSVNSYFDQAEARNKKLQDQLKATAGKVLAPIGIGALIPILKTAGAAGAAASKSKVSIEQAQLALDISGGGWGSLGIKKKPQDEMKFASVAAAGSSEAANAILKSKYGSDVNKQGNDIKTVARNTLEANAHLKIIADKMSGLLVTTPYEFIGDIS